MKVGQIIKNKLHVLGKEDQYMRITDVLGESRYEVQYQEKPTERHIIDKKSVIAPVVVSLSISEEMFFALKKGIRTKVSHVVSERWMAAITKKPDLIRFYTMARHYEGIFSIKTAIKRKSIGEDIVEITINKVIF